MTKYKQEKRLVAFMDVLGFTKIVQEGNKAEKIMNALEKVKEDIKELKKEANLKDLQITWFSDSIVLSYSSIYINDFQIFLNIVLLIQTNLVLNGVLLRGGIAVGECYHRSDRVFGKAMIEAYMLENKSAVTPRIIISNEIVEFINKSKEEEEVRDEKEYEYNLINYGEESASWYFESKTIAEEIIDNLLSRDKDGVYFIGYLEDILVSILNDNDNAVYYKNDKNLYENLYTDIVKPLQDLIIKGLHNDRMDVCVKYIWLQNYFNRVINKFKHKMSKEYEENFLDKLII